MNAETAGEFVKVHKKGIKLAALFAVIGIMLLRGVMQLPQISAGKKEAARLSSQIEYEQQRQEEVAALKDKVGTDEYIEKMASEKLGLVKNNAKIFVDVSGEQQ